MKKSIALLLFIVTSTIYAQNSGITYQAVIYNPSTEILPGNNNPNVVLANKEICLRFSIKDAASSLEYQEVQKVKTDEFGMVNLVVGQGNQISGYAANFGAIVWNSSNKTLAVAIDKNANCSNFIEVSEQFFSAVPFAYASKVAETVSGIVPIVNGGTGAATVAGAKTNLGLNNVDNTSDLNKPVSTATQTALNAKENAANKSNSTSLGTSDVLFPTQNAVKVYVDTQMANTTVPDASITTKGKIQLAGDLGGTADAPTVPGLANKENTIAAGTTAQYYRGDKTWQTLDKAAVGLANVENTSDANKPISTATQAALDLKAPIASPGFTGIPTAPTAAAGTSTTQIATTAFVNATLATAASPDATTTLKGRIQLAGDLAGTADVPTIATNAITTTKIAAGAVTDAKITSVNSSKIIGSIPVTQINGAVSKVNGVLPDGDGSVVIPFGMVRTGTFLARPAVGSTTNGDIYVVSGDSNTNNNGLTYISDGANWNEVTPNQASLDARYLKLGGGTMSGNIVVPTGKFVSIADAPTNPIDAANKAYVDSVVTGGATPNATTTTLGKIQLAGDLEGTADLPLIKNSAVIGKVLTGYTASAGTVVATDNMLQAIQKVDGNVGLKANINSPIFTGTVSGIDKTMVGLNNVDNTSDADKPLSTATQAALNSKVDKVTGKGLSSEDYTTADKTKLDGIEAGAEKNVNADWNATTGDAQILNKPTIPSIAGLATETFVNNGLALKANLASPTFTGDATAATAATGDNDTSIATTAFVNTAITNAATPNATTTATGKVQLAGDLGGAGTTAAAPIITDNAITPNKIATAAVTPVKIQAGSTNSVLVTNGTGAVAWLDQGSFGAKADDSTIEGVGTTANPFKVKADGIDTDKIKNNAVINAKLADDAVTNAKIGETIAVENGGTGATSLTGYLKGNGTNAFTAVSKIPVADVDGAVRKVNGVVPDANGNVAVIIGRVFTGATVNPDLAASIISASPAKKSSDIYIVADGSNPNNGRTFIYDGTIWLEVATNLSTTDARYVNVAGDTMEGDLTFPTGTKIIIDDAPTGSTDAVNKAYVDGLITSSATPDATASDKGKLKLTNHLGGTADMPTVPGLALKAPLESPSLTGTPLAPTAAAGTNTTQIATTAFVTAATAGKQNAITLTTTGTGAASLVGSTLNIPTPNNGTVTNVAALTIGTSGTDITSTVATATTTPVITLNVPTASAANRGALSATDWATFNNKIGGSGTATQVPFFSSSTNLTSAPEFTYNNTTKNLTVGLLNDNTTRFTVNGAIKGNADGGALLLQDGANNQIFRGLWNFFGSPLVSTQYFQMGNNNVAFTGFNGGKLTRASFRTDGFQISSQTDINIPNPVGVFEVRGATTPLMNVLANGNVGIGTTGPANKLEITQGTAGNSGLRFTNLTASSAATTASSKVLGLNSNGDVILTNVPGTQNIVSFSTVNPNSGSPTFTPAQSMDQSVVYQSSVDNSMWTYNGTTYVTYSPPASTAWNLANTTNDAGSNKTSGIFRTGNVGIGTNNPTTNLDVVGGFNLRNTAGAAGSNFGMEFNTNSSSPRIDWVYNGNYTGSFAGDADFFFRLQNSRLGTGGFRFMTNPSGTAVERMTILNNGNIGIGNINPTATLDVQSPLISTFVTTARFLTPNNTTAGNSNVLNFGVTATTGNSADWRYVYQANGAASNRIDFGMSGYAAPMMSYLNSGNVGIGTTAPATRLHIQGQTATTTINADAQLLRFSRPGVSSIKWDHVAQFNLGAYNTNINANTRLDLALNDGATLTPSNVMTWLANGNVGINNTAPSAPLVVQANTVGTGVLKLAVPSVGSDNWWMGFSHGINNSPDSNDRARIGVDIVSGGAGRLYFTTGLPGSQTRAMFIDQNQRVGIGTSTPISTLEVNGSATNTVAFNSGSATAILFNNSNLAYTSSSPTAFNLQGMKDGGTYTLAVQGTTSGTASFSGLNPSNVAFVFKSINNGTTIAGKDTLYTFVVMGTTVYVYMATGF